MKNEKILIKRHIVKSISYRFLGTLQTIVISYILTNNFIISSSLGVIELCIKPLIYFLHERVWYKYIKFGVRKETPIKKQHSIINGTATVRLKESSPIIIQSSKHQVEPEKKVESINQSKPILPEPKIAKETNKKILNYSSSR